MIGRYYAMDRDRRWERMWYGRVCIRRSASAPEPQVSTSCPTLERMVERMSRWRSLSSTMMMSRVVFGLVAVLVLAVVFGLGYGGRQRFAWLMVPVVLLVPKLAQAARGVFELGQQLLKVAGPGRPARPPA